MLRLELSPSTQFTLICLLAAAIGALLARAMIVIYREKTGIAIIYPSGWSAAQCQTVERFRLLIGLALVPLWGWFLYVAPSVATTNKWPFGIFWDSPIWGTFFIAPSAPPSWPFGYYLDGLFMILLLLISNAWALLLVPRNWQRFGSITRSFRVTIAFLAVWWGVTFWATGWMFATVSAPSPSMHLIPGNYAAKGFPPLIETPT